MSKITHIAETVLYVDNLSRAEKFYTELFECAVIHRDDRLSALRIADEQVLLLFLRGTSLQPTTIDGGIIPTHDGSGPLHVCFGIRANELNQWDQKLAQLGIAVESRVCWPAGATSLYLRDPDRHLLELATPGLWS